ncbi:vamp-associated protein [Ceraceosorus bombacis]|uniref:Vamp-associated protein n=1 Tax=Ceraceosorus bombacis TaxID=401625 RepID=A0A0P1BKM5_9BASI|nr:vamp-associated protein [Ceraceosorus bombacis]
MSVDLNPHVQLGFPRPLTQLVKRSLQVSNPHAQPVAFKVKTTAPKQYCVRPNSGRIEPGEKVEVQVLLQPMKEEPPTSAKCRDKFLVQSTIITPERETTSLSELWGVVEKEDKSAIHEQKIRVAFLPAATAPVPEEEEHVGSNISNGDEKYSTVRGTPSRGANGSSPGNDDGSFSSPTQGSTSPANGTTNPIAAARSAAANTDGGALAASRNAAVAAGGAAAAGAGAAFAATKSAGSRAVEKTPAEYQSEIKRLQQQLDSAAKKGAQQIQSANSEGVSLQVVGVLLVASFLLGAYLL